MKAEELVRQYKAGRRDFSEANLSGADLRTANLSGANLRRANLSKADLHLADLRRANLSGADLIGANLSEADLSGANLRGANLYGANLSDASLYGANLRRANLRGADLSYVNLRRANLRDTNLSGANLREANLNEANLSRANLSEADLRRAYLSWANLSGANLSGAKGFLDPTAWLQEQFESDAKGLIVYKAIGETYYAAPDHWTIEPGAVLEEVCNPTRTNDCACGVNFATLEWIKQREYASCDVTVWRCRIEWMDLAGVVVPYNTDGKARCARLQLLERVEA